MPHTVTAVAPGLQALILCGPGSSFPTFTANPDENPKALIPIANRPMVWYPLSFCYRVGITDITLICPPTAAEALNASLKTNPFLTSLPLPSPTLLAPKGLTHNTGTAEILRLPEVRAAVTKDFFVLPCDLVCELGGDKLVQAWMVKSASLGDLYGPRQPQTARHNGGLGVWYDTSATPIKGEETDFIITTSVPVQPVAPPKGSVLPHLANLVYSLPTDSLNDLTEEQKGFPIRHGLLRRRPRVRMLTNHRDAHIYIFPHWVMDFVNRNEHLESIGEDVVGWWAKAGWQAGLGAKLGLDKILGLGDKQKDGDDREWPLNDSDVSPPSPVDDGSLQQNQPANSRSSQRDPSLVKQEFVPPILAYVHPSQPSQPLIRRVDTAQSLLETSLQLAKLPSIEETGAATASSPFAHARKVAYPEGVRPRTTITRADCLVGENVIIEEKTSIKESVIGANCKIEEGAKLQHCLLMDGAVVGKGCRLVRCILGKRSEIGEGSTLMDCEVQENLLVEPKTEEKNNRIMSSSGLEATEEEMQEVLQGLSDEEAAL